MTADQIASLAMFLLATALAALPGVIFRPGNWYRGLAKPRWCPPDRLFGPVWLALYVSIAVSGWMIWIEQGVAAMPALVLFVLQLVLNGLWSTLFFGLRKPGAAAFEVLLLFAAILATIAAFYPLRPAAALLLMPYAAWVGFAVALNWSVWRLNSGRPSSPAR